MRALRFHNRPDTRARRPWAGRGRDAAFARVSLDDVAPPPLPGPDWVRVGTTLAGIAATDLALLRADEPPAPALRLAPFVLGHENVGRIVEAGPAAADAWSTGSRVAVSPLIACAQRGLEPCPACARGEPALCRRTAEGAPGAGARLGESPAAGGGWAGSFVAHTSQLHRLDGLSDEAGVVAHSLAWALRAVLLHPPAPGDTVLVLGAGELGGRVAQALRLTGWSGPIAMLARHAAEREDARRAGATPVFDRRAELYRWAATLPGARAYRPSLAPRFVEGGPSLVFDTLGDRRSTGDALSLTREGGRIILLGAASSVAVDWTRVWYRQLTLAGVAPYGLAPLDGEPRDVFAHALDLIRRDGLAESSLPSRVFHLEEYRAAFAVALDPDGHRSAKVAFRPRS